jgi:hypothetical protein
VGWRAAVVPSGVVRILAATLLGLAGCAAAPGPVVAPSNAGGDAAARATAIPGRSAGPIRLAMTGAAVRAALGAPEVDDGKFLQYYRRGLSIALVDGVVDAIHLYRGVPGGYETEPWQRFELRLPGGLRWSSTEAQVRAALGAPTGTGDLSGAPIPSKWIDYPGLMFDFRVDDGRMFHVVVSAPAPLPAK